MRALVVFLGLTALACGGGTGGGASARPASGGGAVASETDADTDAEPPSGFDGDCPKIDCDCEHVSFGLLTEAYREECEVHEKKLKDECAATGTITETCETVVSGPGAYPK